MAAPTARATIAPVAASTVNTPASSQRKLYAPTPSPPSRGVRPAFWPTPSVNSPSMVTSVGADTIFRVTLAFFPLNVLAVIFAVPGATATTSPSASTVATAGSLLA